MDSLLFHVNLFINYLALTFIPMVVSVCKKKNKFVYDKEGNISEKILLPLNFTVDIRFFNLTLAKEFIADVKLNFFLLFRLKELEKIQKFLKRN